jgi:hypothetical protein
VTVRPAAWQVTVADGDLEPLAGMLAAYLVRTKGASSPETRTRRAAARRLHAQITDALTESSPAPRPRGVLIHDQQEVAPRGAR